MLLTGHRRYRIEVHQFVDGALPVVRVPTLADHLEECPRCRTDLMWWLSIRDALCRLATCTDNSGQT